MTLPRFLHANPVAALAALDDDDTAAYRALLGRWLIDLALLLGWGRTGRRRHPFRQHPCWDNDEFLALTGLAESDEESDDADEDRETGADGPGRRSVSFISSSNGARNWRGCRSTRNCRWCATWVCSPSLLGLSEAELAVLVFRRLSAGGSHLSARHRPTVAEHEHAVSPQAVGAVDRPPSGRYPGGPESHRHPASPPVWSKSPRATSIWRTSSTCGRICRTSCSRRTPTPRR